MIASLPPEVRRQVDAAERRLRSGEPLRAKEELEKVNPPHGAHPDVLEVRWRVCAAIQRWDLAFTIATVMTRVAPERVCGWVQRAHSLHGLARTIEARQLLLMVGRWLEADAMIPYWLACYCCRLRRLGKARRWLAKAFALAPTEGELNRLQLRAFQESELEPLRTEIGELSRGGLMFTHRVRPLQPPRRC